MYKICILSEYTIGYIFLLSLVSCLNNLFRSGLLARVFDMPLKEITDRKGPRFTWVEIGVHSWPLSVSNLYFPQDPEKQLKEVKSFEIRDNDVLICTFPKAGGCGRFQFHYENKDQLHNMLM